MPITASIVMIGAKKWLMFGKSGRLKRIMPYVPIFNRTPASITDPLSLPLLLRIASLRR